MHLVQRGINREPCFFVEEDYHSYLHWLQKSAADCETNGVSFALIPS